MANNVLSRVRYSHDDMRETRARVPSRCKVFTIHNKDNVTLDNRDHCDSAYTSCLYVDPTKSPTYFTCYIICVYFISQVGRERLDSLVFISSGYLRARQTAEECRAALQNILSFERQVTWSERQGDNAEVDETISVEDKDQTEWLKRHGGYDVSPTLLIRPELRERFFSELDGTILVNYNKVRHVLYPHNRTIAFSTLTAFPLLPSRGTSTARKTSFHRK